MNNDDWCESKLYLQSIEMCEKTEERIRADEYMCEAVDELLEFADQSILTKDDYYFNIIYQEIVPRSLVRGNDDGSRFHVEVFFKPEYLSAGYFYKSVSFDLLLVITKNQIRKLMESIEQYEKPMCAIGGEYVGTIFFNVEARVLEFVEEQLRTLNIALRAKQIKLVIDISERNEVTFENFLVVRRLANENIHFSLGDISNNNIGINSFLDQDLKRLLDTQVFDYVKITIPEEYYINTELRDNFIDEVNRIRNIYSISIIVIGLETLEQMIAIDRLPYDFSQGFLLSSPIYISEFIYNYKLYL